jgi:hypothetical protein
MKDEKSIKELYSFSIEREKEVEVIEETEAGKLTRVEKQLVPVKIILKKPSRIDVERIDEYYAISWSQLVRNGVLTKPQLLKLYSDEIGTMTNADQESYFDLYHKYFELKESFIAKKGAGEEAVELEKQIQKIYMDIQDIENKQASVFDQTAEVKARNKTIQWLMLNLTFMEENEKPVPFFKGNTLDEKADYYYESIESKESFFEKVVDRAALTWSFWYMGRASSREDFEKALGDAKE